MLRILIAMIVAGYACSIAGSHLSMPQLAQLESETLGPLDRIRKFRQSMREESNESSPVSSVRKDTPFGLHAVGMPFLSRINDSNASIIRIIISGHVWKKIETKHGLDFSKLDRIVRELQKNGIDLVITLDPNSEKWGASHLFKKKMGGVEPTTHSDKPAKAELYGETLRAIVERYDNDGIDDMPGLAFSVDYYQIVNEWVWQWESGEKDYLDHLKTSWKIITKAHPHAQIILGGLTGVEHMAVDEGVDSNRSLKLGGVLGMDRPKVVTIDELKRKKPGQVEKNSKRLKYLLTEGQPYYDIIDLHTYTESYKEMLPSIEIIRKYAPHKEIWSLENAGPFYRYSPEKHSEEIVKRYLAALANGINKLFWSSYNPTGGWSKNFTNLSLIDSRGREKAAYHSFRFLAANMAGFQNISRMELGSGVEAYKVTNSDNELYVVWADGKKQNVRLPWRGSMEGLRAVRLHVVNDRRMELQDVPLTLGEGQVKFDVSDTPVFVGRSIKQY